MLAGTPGARSVIVNFSPPTGGGFFCPVPGCAADGVLPPAGTPCPIFSYSDNAWGGTNIDAVKIYNMTVNWVPTTPTATITATPDVPAAAFDASYNASWNDCVQPGTTQKLDGIGGVIMYRAQWKTWANHNSVVLNWAVNISASQRSIKWCELRQNKTTGVWSMYQEGIYTPDADTRWMGAIAMDNNGSIGLSYMKSNATSTFPGLYYTGRRECDPLGTMPITEVMVVAGTGYQTGTNRNGDYAHTCLDPDGFTFWSTSEYMGGTSGGSAARTRIFSYTIDGCTTDASVFINVTSGSNPTCNGANMTFTATPYNGGTAPSYQWKVDGVNVGTNNASYSTSALTAGQVVTCVMTSNLSGVTANPATSNAITISVAPAVTPSVSIAQTAGTNPTCPGVGVTFTATPVNGGTTPSFQWQVNGVNAGTNSNTFSSSTLANGSVVRCILTSNAQCPTTPTANSNEITLAVTSSSNPTVSITSNASGSVCTGTPVTFTAAVSGGSSPNYQWKVDGVNVGTNSNTYSSSSLANGQVVTCQVTTAGSCPTFYNLGTGTSFNSLTSGAGAAYATYYGNGRQQYIIRATELTALGLSAGSSIGSIGFDVGSATGDPLTLNGFTIKMGNVTATTATTTFLTGASTVFGPVNYTPTLNSINTHTLATPFVWNGTSNIIVESCFSNQVVGNQAYQTRFTNPGFLSCTFYQVDGATGANACNTTTGTNTTNNRPNMKFGVSGAGGSATSNAITVSVSASATYYADSDGDGYGNASSSTVACSQPSGYVTNSTDCNDGNANINPAATEVCNTADDDCDGQINEGVGNTYYADADGDGYGNAASSTVACTQPSGFVTNSTDCNDSNANINPAATEVCNTADDDCDGQINEGVGTTYYADSDGDGYGNAASSTVACTQPSGFVANSTDCNDSNASVNSAATESCTNSIDDNCDGQINEGCCSGAPATPTAIDGPYGVCRNSTGNVFTTPSVAGATSYQWTLPTGATGSSTTNSITLSFSSTYNTGSLSVRAVGPCGTSAAFTRSVFAFTTVPTAPTSISGPSTNVCASSTQTYTCTAVSAATSYTWTAPTNATIVSGQGTQTVTVSFASNFGANGALSVRSVNCFGQSAARTLTVYNIPGTPGTISGAGTNVCPGSVLTYSVTAVPGASSYTWTAPTNTTIVSGQGTNSISLSIGSTFTTGTLSVRAVSTCGQSAARTLGLSKNPATPSTMSGQIANLCGGGQFTYSVTAVTGAVSYNWTVPSGCTIVSNNGNSIVLNIPSTFTSGTLTVQAVNSCGGISTRSASLTRLPATPASITGPASVCPNQVGVVFTTPAVTGVTQLWAVPTGGVITAGQSTTSMTCTWGTVAGSVTVRSVNACGQSTALSKSVTLLTCMEEQGGTPAEQRMSDLNVYPNPNDGSFTVRSAQAGTYRLLSSTGQLIYEIQLNETNNFSFEVNGLSTGLYFLQGITGTSYVQQKVVVTNR